MELTKRAVRGTLIVAGSTYLIDIIGLARSIVLARLLIPEYFGVVALASFFYNFVRQLKEFNFDTALIHKSNPSEDAFSTHFVLKVALAIINFLIIIIISPILTKFYGPTISKIIFIFTFFSIFQETTCTPRVVLEKELLFSKVAIISIFKEIIKTVIPIVMALKGFGLWSLVAMGILDMIVPLLGYMVIRPWKFSLRFNKEMAIWFFKFSFYMWVGGLCMTLMYEFDNFLVGTFVGALALGLYVKAYEFSKLPTQMVTHIINKVSLPLYSKLKEDKIELSKAFNNFLYIIIRLTLPFSLLLFIIAPEFVYIFLGNKWAGAVLLLRLLIIYSVSRSVQDDCGALLFAVGKPRFATRILLVQALMMVVLGPVFVYLLGVNGMAISVDLMTIVGVILSYKVISIFIDVEFRRNFIAPILSAISALVLVLVFMRFFCIAGLLNRLIMKFILFLGVYTLILILLTKNELRSKFRYILELLR